jgi:hypothetical protein
MLRLGHKALALETALEQWAVVAGMQPVLVGFGNDPDANVAVRAIRHLAMYYGVMHPRAAEFRITQSLDWDPRAIRFDIQIGDSSHADFLTVLYAHEGSSFSDDDAWSLIDGVVDPRRRGALLPHNLAFDDAAAPLLMGSALLFRFEGAHIELHGDVDEKVWKRLMVRP